MKKQTFSQYFKLGKSQYELDFVDVPINDGDIPLFIDPYAIAKRTNRWSIQCNNLIVTFFQKAVDHIRNGQYSKAQYMFSGLREPNQTRFGLSTGKVPRGRGIGGDQAIELYNALKDSSAVQTGFLRDLEDCELLIEGISRDKISDMTTNIIRAKLIEYTQSQCNLFGIETHQVPSGLIWDDHNEKWTSIYTELPICHRKSVILIPKATARFDTEYNHQEYYQHFVLNFLQAEHLSANSSLVRVLKDGTKKEPTKKSLKEKYPLSKQYLYEFSKEHPDVLSRYKKSKASDLRELTDEIILEMTEQPPQPNYNQLATELANISPGDADATRFHNHMKGVLTAIFYPSLVNPVKEQEIHDGRKRIDLVYENSARSGFFFSLPQIKNIPSAYIMIECKNYSADPKNPELDQLSGRFSVNRGRFGFLICRTFANKKLFYQRCKDTASDDRGFIIPLDDKDVRILLGFKRNNDFMAIDKFLDERFRMLVM
jgi:hypothetical protein